MIGRALACLGLLAGSAAVADAPAPPRDILQRHAVSGALAVEIARQAVRLCGERGAAVSAAVADAAGDVRTMVSADEVGTLSIETARRKARAAAILGFPTATLAQAAIEAPPYAAMLRDLHPEFVFLPGGLPIRIGDELVGSIGVGGARDGGQDERCAADALAQFADRLK